MSGQREDRKEGTLSKVIGILILLAGAAGVFYAAYKVSYVSVDYGIHVGIARDLDWSDPVRMLREHPEPVWHILVHALMNVTGFSAEKAAGLVSGGLCALTCLLAAHFLYHPVSIRGRRRKKANAGSLIVSGESTGVTDGLSQSDTTSQSDEAPLPDELSQSDATSRSDESLMSDGLSRSDAASRPNVSPRSDDSSLPGGPLTAPAETDGNSTLSSQPAPAGPVSKNGTAAAAAVKSKGARTGRITVLGAALAATALSFASAIYVPWFNAKPYLGQGSPNPWHNPTTLIVRPIGLLIVMIVMGECLRVQRGGFRKKNGLRVWKGVLIAVLLLLSNLSKPSFVQIFYPAIFLLMFLWLFVYRGRNFPLGMQLLVCCLPSCALMGAQFFSAFYSGSNSDAAGVVFAPFKVAGLYTDNIAVSTLLVIAFPLLTCLFSIFRRTFDWTDFFAWLMLLVGMAEKFLLAESGSRMTHGNFNWGYILGLYFIWFSGIRLFTLWAHSLNEGAGGAKKAVSIMTFSLCGAVLGLHLLSGIYYLYYLIVLGNGI
ncbi:MAG: hypothetical protein Q4F51_02780 [Sarcina sp.]|nr:hypothetical protein [Sarcina sp.]